MKKKLALLLAAIMTVAAVPVTAFASTKLTAVDEITTSTDKVFLSRVELSKKNDQVDIENQPTFDVQLKLTNGKFATMGDVADYFGISLPSQIDEDDYIYDRFEYLMIFASMGWIKPGDTAGIRDVEVKNDTTAVITLDTDTFNGDAEDYDACVVPIFATAVSTGDVVAKFSSNVTAFKTASEVIATAVDGEVEISTDKVTTFVEDSEKTKKIEDITIKELTSGSMGGTFSYSPITLKLKGNYEFALDETENNLKAEFLNQSNDSGAGIDYMDEDELVIGFGKAPSNMLSELTISGIYITATKKCSAGDVATISVSSDDFDTAKLEVAKMVEEAVTYTVEDKDLPVIWAGADADWDENADMNTLKLSVEENVGDILNTSRKATFTFPEGIEVVDSWYREYEFDGWHEYGTKGVEVSGVKGDSFKYEVDENVVTIWNYGKTDNESDAKNGKVDMDIKFVLNAAPTFTGDVECTLGGEFDDVTLKVATVKAPYTVEAKTNDVLIDYRYVPVSEITITEAEDGILEDDDVIALAVEKMDFDSVGDIKVTEGDIEVDTDIDEVNGSSNTYLLINVKDASTEASTIVISGVELYLDRTLPVGGYALLNVSPWDNDEVDDAKTTWAGNILWQNSYADKGNDDPEDLDWGYDLNGYFKYKEMTVNDSYVNVITQARDQDDSMTNRKIVITVGATTMAAGQDTITLDAPAYINSENFTMLPVRAISEAFGATVNWDATSRTVTILSGQRIISMTIGSRTMYVNGTPVAMNTSAAITNERTFVPVRDLANAIGISAVNWTEASGTVTLN